MGERIKCLIYYSAFVLMLTTLWTVAWARSISADVEHYRLSGSTPPVANVVTQLP